MQKSYQTYDEHKEMMTPGDYGKNCLYNGTYPGYEIACDACDYDLTCFPDWEKDFTNLC